MQHHTTDPAERAADIAEREAEEARRRGADYSEHFLRVYREALRELTSVPIQN